MLELGLAGSASEGTTGNPNFRVDIGSVLKTTLRLWASNLLPFCVVGLVVLSPVIAGMAAIAIWRVPMPRALLGLNLLSNLLGFIFTGAVTYGVFQGLRGRHAGIGENLRLGLSRMGTVWITALLTGIYIALGFCALIVPGLIIMTRYWVAIPAAVIEQAGARASMTRSEDLTAGTRWQVFAVLLLIGIAEFVAAAVVTAVAEAPQFLRASESEALKALLVQSALIPWQAFAAAAPAVVYHDLRVGKEGADVEELLRVFE